MSKAKATKKKKKSVGRPVSNIPVPKETLDFWSENYQVGDFTKIASAKDVGRPTVRSAWRGISSQENIDKITAFYNDRKKAKVITHERIKLAEL